MSGVSRGRVVAVAAVFVTIGAAIGAVVTRQLWPSVETTTTQRFRAFCSATRDAVRQDRLAFETGDGREEAYQRFLISEVTYHGRASISACIDAMPNTPPCLLIRDWPCIARFALEVEQRIHDPR